VSEHDDEELSPEERSEAEALVEALERGRAREALPEDALETAALLRYSRDGGELGADRQRAVLDDVWASAKRPVAETRSASAFGWLKWLVPVGGLGAAAAVALLFATLQTADEPAATSELPVAFPAPGAELLRAQAAVASGDEGQAERLAEAMRDYRTEVYAALDTRYGGGGR